MTTRIDIEDHLAESLRAIAKSRGISLREYVADLLEEALAKVPVETQPKERFVQRTHDFGVDIENPWSVIVEFETGEYTKLLTKK